jgi:CubicO group peptidase (beta-lactamase class C family)
MTPNQIFMKTFRLGTFLVLILFVPALGQVPSKQLIADFDKLISEQFKPNESGCAVLVSQKGNVIYKKAFGLADIELNVPMQPDMVFRIGSITKQFTAVSILQLMEQGKLGLQDEITKFIPDYPTQAYKITIEHLLTHTSGIQSYTGMKTFQDMIRKDMKPEEVIDIFKNQPMEFAPGTKWNYNNSGYFLLGYIIEKASGKSYPQYLEENIFKPLGMTNSYYGSNNRIIHNRASGYQPGKDGIVNADIMSMTIPYAAGSIQSTVEDLFKWHQAVHSYKLVKKESLEKAFTEYKLADGKGAHYGYGWALNSVQGSPTIEHGGGINGFLTNALYLPNEDVFVAVFSNSNAKSPNEVSIRLAAATIGKPYNYKEIALDDASLDSYTGVYESEDGSQRTITREGKQLFSQRTGGAKNVIKAYAPSKFFFTSSLATLEFEKDPQGKFSQVTSSERSSVIVWKKTNKPVPSERKEAKVSEELLARYTGEYKMTPGFSLTITKEGQKLFAQATGQGKNEIYPESDTKFFLKVVDAQLEFSKDTGGVVSKLILYQGGQRIEGIRTN